MASCQPSLHAHSMLHLHVHLCLAVTLRVLQGRQMRQTSGNCWKYACMNARNNAHGCTCDVSAHAMLL